MRASRLPFLVFFVAFVLLADNASAGDIFPTNLIQNGGYIVSRDGHIISKYREDELFTTASTIKLLTSLTVLDVLGKDYRYITSYYLDNSNTLYIKGSGDPFLTSEYLSQIVDEIKRKGVRRISGYVLDDTAFMLEHYLPDGSENSSNPYDAPNGALAINFNSISIIKQTNGKSGSGEAQTPTAPITTEIGQKILPGSHRININHFPLTGNIQPQLRYTAEIMHELAKKAGINSHLVVRRGVVPVTLEPFFEFTSPRSLVDNIRSCLYYSNNFIANQLILTAGARHFGYPATWEKARKLLNSYAHETLKIPFDAIHVEEGSGLSRKNSASPRAMLMLLDEFYPYRNLLPRKNGGLVKSGTMKSIFCYAGYLDKQNPPTAFAFLLNQEKNTRNRLLGVLKKHLASISGG